jgi:large subunit ribosomal protein L14e
MMDVGRLCVKIAGRDAGMKCVIVDVLDEKFVMIDGETRRRKCNLKHLEPLGETLTIKKGASHDIVKSEFKKLGIALVDSKPRAAKPKLTQVRSEQRKKLAAPVEPKKAKVEKVKTEKPAAQ